MGRVVGTAPYPNLFKLQSMTFVTLELLLKRIKKNTSVLRWLEIVFEHLFHMKTV